MLEREVKPVVGKVQLEMGRRGQLKQEFMAELEKGSEGVIVKDLLSVYRVNHRGVDWVKMKADHLFGLTDTLDLLILAGYYTSGQQGKYRQGSLVRSFLVGAKGELGYVPFCKVSSGFSEADIAFINQMVVFTQSNEEVASYSPDVCVQDVRKSLILEVKASEIIKSENLIGCTLRFPRLVRIRNDKCFKDCMTVGEIQEISELNNKMLKKNLSFESRAPSPSKKSKLQEVESGLFANQSFHLAAPCPEELKSLILSHSGTVHSTPTPKTCFVISSERSYVLSLYAKFYPVLRPEYVYQCVRDGRVLPQEKQHRLILTEDQTWDRFGVDWASQVSTDNLLDILESVKELDDVRQDTKQWLISEIGAQIQPQKLVGKFFFVGGHSLRAKILKILLQLNGGEVVEEIGEHVFVVQEYFEGSAEQHLCVTVQEIKDIILQ